MAIVEVNSTWYGSRSGGIFVPPVSTFRDGHLHHIEGSVPNGAADSNTSKYLLCELPWTATLMPETAFRTDGWGFAQAVIGSVEANTGLLNAAKGASATGQLPITIFGAKWNKQIWEQLGLSAPPTDKGYCKLYAYAVAAAAGAGAMQFHITFANHMG